jgi:hypothetical protein
MEITGKPHERRTSERLDVYRVIQFKPLKATAGYSLGISRNLSYEGLSFESQVVDIEPGEELELVFKNPRGSVDVSCRGSIIWKKESDKFKTFAGISFQNLNKIARDNIMNMLSLSRDMFNDTFSSREYTEERPVKETSDTVVHKEEPEPEPARKNEGQLYSGETEVGDDKGYVSKADTYNSDLTPEKDGHRKKIGLYVIIASFVLTVIVIAVLIFISNAKKDIGTPSITTGERASPPAAAVERTLPADANTQKEKLEYTIQVGAWKNPEYAREMLLKLKKYYSGIYMYKKNNFNFIKIRGIPTQQQGAAIVQDINKRFGLKPILAKPEQ